MTAATVQSAPSAPSPAVTRTRSRTARPLIMVSLVLLVFAGVRLLTDANELTSDGTLSAAINSAIPLGLAGLAGLWSERAGVVNVGLEGMMILGTWGAGWAGSSHGVWAGLAVGIAMGAVGGLVHAVVTVTFGVDQIVSGVAINLLGYGAAQFLSSLVFKEQPTQSPEIPALQTFTLPWLPDALEKVVAHHWFFVSDLASVLHALTSKMPYFTVLAVVLLPVTYVILWRTAFGLRLRSCGEAPYAAETLGVIVSRYKYVAVFVSGGLAGFGGAFLAIFSGIYREGQTGGKGFIGLAAMIFGNWRPGGLAAGAGLFGYTDALQGRSDTGVHALLIVFAIGIGAYSLWLLYRRRLLPGSIGVAAAVVLVLWYRSTDTLPQQLIYVTPYVTTLLVLALAAQRLRMPAADGLIYRRGQGN